MIPSPITSLTPPAPGRAATGATEGAASGGAKFLAALASLKPEGGAADSELPAEEGEAVVEGADSTESPAPQEAETPRPDHRNRLIMTGQPMPTGDGEQTLSETEMAPELKVEEVAATEGAVATHRAASPTTVEGATIAPLVPGEPSAKPTPEKAAVSVADAGAGANGAAAKADPALVEIELGRGGVSRRRIELSALSERSVPVAPGIAEGVRRGTATEPVVPSADSAAPADDVPPRDVPLRMVKETAQTTPPIRGAEASALPMKLVVSSAEIEPLEMDPVEAAIRALEERVGSEPSTERSRVAFQPENQPRLRPVEMILAANEATRADLGLVAGLQDDAAESLRARDGASGFALAVGQATFTTSAVAPLASPPPAPAQSAAAVEQVANVIRTARDGEIEITLSPQELGRVRIVMSHTEAGITLNLSAERDETMHLLKRHAEMLQEALQEQGNGSVDISFGGDRGDKREQGGAAPGHLAASDADIAQAPAKQRLSVATDRLDLRL